MKVQVQCSPGCRDECQLVLSGFHQPACFPRSPRLSYLLGTLAVPILSVTRLVRHLFAVLAPSCPSVDAGLNAERVVLDGDHSAFAASQAGWVGAQARTAPGDKPSGEPSPAAAVAVELEVRREGEDGGAGGVGPRTKLMPCGAGACAGGPAGKGARPYRYPNLRAWRDALLLRLVFSEWAFWELAVVAPSVQVAVPFISPSL